MKHISFIIRLTLTIALIVASVFIWRSRGVVSTAFAVGDLTVNWGVPEGSPIFTVNNMKPGDSESRAVSVQNDGTENRPVAIRGLLDSQTPDFSGVLTIVISEGVADLYGGNSATGVRTLEQFFAESAGPDGIALSTLAPSAGTQYDIVVTFDPDAGNAFQGASIQFDVKIGIGFTLPEECKTIHFSGQPIFGTSGNDRIRGTNKNDLIVGLEGNDRIDASNGNDCIIGGLGNDKIDGSNGNDIIFGNEGNDRLDGSNGDDLMFGGPGNDRIYGTNGNDRIWAEEGDDFVDASNGNDVVYGGSGNDTLSGKNGNDTLVGEEGNDKANGGLGRDTCDAEKKTACEQ